MKRFRATTLAVALLVAISQAGAGARPLQAAGAEVLTNEGVITMTKAGLGDSVVVAKIRASQTAFDLSVDEMVRLKGEGVSDEVLNAMIAAAGAAPDPAAPGPGTTLGRAPAASAPGSGRPVPPTPPESGIYFAEGLGQEEHLVLLEPNVYTQSKETGVWKQAITYGIAKVRYKAVLPGARARLQVETRRPTFYFFFDVPNAGLSNSGTAWGLATSANEFILARLEARKSTRELSVGEDGQYTGRKYGVSEKATRPFDYEKLAPGVYRVTPKADLSDGEYCFLYAGSVAASGAGGGPRLFDFGVRLPEGSQRERRVSSP